MRNRGKTPLEKMWSERGGAKINDLYQVRKKRNKFSLSTMGEQLGFSKEARTSSVKNLVDGTISLTPEYIRILAETLSRYPDTSSNQLALAEEIEASLAVHAGQQMPSLLVSLSDRSLSGVLDLIAQVSIFGLAMAPHGSSSYLIAASPWELALREVKLAIEGWLSISRFEAALVTQGIDETAGFANAENRWRQLEESLDRAQMPLQAAYAHTLWARVLTRAGASSLAEQQARRAESILNQLTGFVQSPKDLEELLPLKYQTFVILGDNARAKTHFGLAIQHYDAALDAITVLPESDDKLYLQDRLIVKKSNTYLLARLKPSEKLIEGLKRLCESDHEPAMKSRAYNALAWYDRNRRGEESVMAVENGRQGVSWAERSGDDHRLAVACQYFGETLLHLGELPQSQSHLETALEKHRPLHYGRRGFTYLLVGRVHAYKALRADLQNARERDEELAYALDCFERANRVFLVRVGRAVNSSYQRSQLLVEHAKWEAFAAWIDFRAVSDHPDPQTTLRFTDRLGAAQDKLDEASRNFGDPFAIGVNQVILDFIRWCALEHADLQQCSHLDDVIEQKLEDLNRPVPLPKGMEPLKTSPFEHELDGHRARLYVMSGTLCWKMGLGGNRSGDFAFGKSVMYASQYDFLSLIDSLWLCRLAIEPEQLRFLFFNKLRPQVKERLELFMKKSSSGWSGAGSTQLET